MKNDQDAPRYANPAFLYDFMGHLAGMADLDDIPDELTVIPQTDEHAMYLIKKYIVPYFCQTSTLVQRYAKATLAYLLSDRERRFDFKEYFESAYAPFDLPDDGRRFFELIWEACFPEESYEISDLAGWTYSTSLSEVETLLREGVEAGQMQSRRPGR